MNATTIRAAIEIYRAIKTYGPVVREVIGDLVALEQKLKAIFEQWHDHPELTDAERIELQNIISEDRTKIGIVDDAPDQPPAPAPTPKDPSAVEYDTKDEAIAHIITGYPIVIERESGKFSIHQVAGPFPGTQVYP